VQDCRTNNCLSVCQRSCKPAGVNIDTCRRIGREIGEQIARQLAALQCGQLSSSTAQHLSSVQAGGQADGFIADCTLCMLNLQGGAFSSTVLQRMAVGYRCSCSRKAVAALAMLARSSWHSGLAVLHCSSPCLGKQQLQGVQQRIITCVTAFLAFLAAHMRALCCTSRCQR
jgi:hypothetical protein